MPKLYRGLLVSCRRNFEKAASSEMFFTLSKELEIEPDHISARSTGISGLISVKLNPEVNIIELMNNLIELESDKAYFIHTLKIKPVEVIIPAELEALESYVEDNIANSFEGSFKIEVSKRHTPLISSDVISTIAKNIDNPVDLTNPDILVLIEIIGNKMGISVIPPHLVYSTNLVHEDSTESDNWFLS